MDSMPSTDRPTAALIDFIGAARDTALPETVRHAARRALVNIIGCMVGGAGHPVVSATHSALAPFQGPPHATLAGRRGRTDALHAALINGLACSAYAFDDTHAQAIVHPSAPVISALCPLAERTGISGREFLTAFAVGIELVCRVSRAISVPPADGDVAWMQTGVAGGIGAAAAASMLLGLDRAGIGNAIGLAAAQASGLRSLHGTMAIPLIPAHAAQVGLRAALLAAGGMACGKATLEAEMGFLQVFARTPDFEALSGALGQRFEILANTFKPYPCGIVIHPVLDACLALREAAGGSHFDPMQAERVRIDAAPVAVKLTGKRAVDAYQARTSLYYWAATALQRGSASIEALDPKSFSDPIMARLQDRIQLEIDETLASHAARVELSLSDGRVFARAVDHCIGSIERPMTDADLDRKFLALCIPVLGESASRRLLEVCWSIEDQAHAAELVRGVACE